MRLEHVNLTVSNLERSIDFYKRLFDVEVRWEGQTSGGTPAVHLGDEHWYLALFKGEARNIPVDYAHTGFNHFGVVVDDLDAAIASLKEMGAPLDIPEPYEPGRRAYAFDPDGHEFAVIAKAR